MLTIAFQVFSLILRAEKTGTQKKKFYDYIYLSTKVVKNLLSNINQRERP